MATRDNSYQCQPIPFEAISRLSVVTTDLMTTLAVIALSLLSSVLDPLFRWPSVR